jgi:ribosomal protein S18 acetylase RimI-like enzyme
MFTQPALQWRHATLADAALLAHLNRHLIEDEGHRNRMTVAELEARMRGWLGGEYHAIVFEQQHVSVAYALYRTEHDGLYLRQFFVDRQHRQQGIGRQAVHLLQTTIWPPSARVTLEVLVQNQRAQTFWQAVGFRDYATTMEYILPPR